MKYLSAVSGGGYIAAADAITRSHSEDPALESSEPWSRGSPEARNLRTNVDYLAPGLFGQWWFALNALWGGLLNLAPIAFASVAVGGIYAWLLRGFQPGLQDDNGARQLAGKIGTVNFMRWTTIIGLAALVSAVLLVGRWRRLEAATPVHDDAKAELRARAEAIRKLTGLLTIVAAVLVGGFMGLPLLVWLGRIVSGLGWALLRWQPFSWDLNKPGTVPTGSMSFLTTAVLVSFLLVTSSIAVALARRSRAYRTMLALAGLSGPLLVMIPGIAMAHRVFAVDPDLNWEFSLIAFSVLFCLVSAVWAHNGRYSMHMYYRERLAGVFTVARSSGGEITELHDRPIWFSEIDQPDDSPELVMCAALNVSDRVVPRGRQSAPFTFTKSKSSSPVFDREFKTSEIERSFGMGSPPLTLPSIVAISGAALSPVMGRLTIRPLRFLLAVLNVRLGVWIPNPSAEYQLRRDERLAARVAQDARRVGKRAEAGKPIKRRDKRRYPDASSFRCISRYVVDGWREPGALYVWREATGSMKLDRPFVYVTDGGHWDNLGLFELVRRRCNRIVCFDASLDPNDDFEPLRTAVALCRSDLGVDIDIDPRPLTRNDDGVAETDTVVGRIHYPDMAGEGRLVYTRATICTDTPAVLALRAQRHSFPDHSTGDQFFTDDELESFRALGHAAAMRSLTAVEVAGFRPLSKHS